MLETAAGLGANLALVQSQVIQPREAEALAYPGSGSPSGTYAQAPASNRIRLFMLPALLSGSGQLAERRVASRSRSHASGLRADGAA